MFDDDDVARGIRKGYSHGGGRRKEKGQIRKEKGQIGFPYSLLPLID